MGLNRSTYYYNIEKRNKSYNTTKDTVVKKGGRAIPGYSFDKTGNKVYDDQLNEYIL